jgi:hypothetical protein
MARRQEGYVAPVSAAIADGATTPDPGVAGITVWSSTENALVTWTGTAWRIVPGGQTINDQTALGSADPAADFLLIWDTSASATRKVLPSNLGLGGGSVVGGTVTLTVPRTRGGALEHVETLAATGVTPGQRILVTLAAHEDADENHEEMLPPMSIAGLAGTNEITFTASFLEPVEGPIKFHYRVI